MPANATTRRGRAHLRLVPEDDWPVDLVPFLERARTRMLEVPAPQPSPEVLAYLEQPAHGKVEADGSLARPIDPEPYALELATGPTSTGRRRLVGVAGAAAALVLVAFGLRPAVTSSSPEVDTAPATTAEAPSTAAPSTTPAPTVTVSPAALIGGLAEEVPPAGTDPTTTAAPPATVAPPPPSTPASTRAPRRTTRPAPATTAPPAPAQPAATPEEAVLRYYDAANVRFKCVAKQPSGASRDQLRAACGPEVVPPENLLRFWSARNDWFDCAQPLIDRGIASDRIQERCGPRPDRAAFGVPPNPYSSR
jgi:hypothetical protein